MARIRSRAVVQCSVPSVVLESLTFVCLRPRLSVATSVSQYRVNFLVLAVASFIAVGCLAFFSAPQILSFRMSDPTETAGILPFSGAPVVPAQVEAHE
jgi:hypothetical protein